MPGKRTASRTKHYGHIGHRREGLVAIPEEEVEGDTQMGPGYSRAVEHTISIASSDSPSPSSSSTATTATIRCIERGMTQLREWDSTSMAKDNTFYDHRDTSPPETQKIIPPQTRKGGREHRPVTLRWESPKSTIQLEDLLFGIGSQFDDMTLSPRQLSCIDFACDQNPDDRPQPPGPSLSSSMAPTAGGPDALTMQPQDMTPAHHHEDADEDTILLVDKADVSSRSSLLPVASAAPRPKPAPSYLRRLSGTLASTMRRVCAGLWNLVRWKVCNGVRVHRRPRRQQGGLEKRGGRGGVIYLV
ncbi:hypothetical protein PG985_012547 [Apiospora marii]|uniref:Uncharacterized protein n=1 Tax=Apiospora marii TaxID=335849 RepID=A0ABR1RD01_9PEZI